MEATKPLGQNHHNKLFQKDLFEAVGFQNGFKPWTDTRAVGIMGLNLVKNFFYRVEVFYSDAKKVLERNKAPHLTINKIQKNILIDNLQRIS